MTGRGGGLAFILKYSWHDLSTKKVIWLTGFTAFLFVILGMAMAVMVIVPASMDTRRKLELEKKPNSRTLFFGPPVITSSREAGEKTWNEVANLMKGLKPVFAREVVFAKSIQLHWKRTGSEGLESLKGRVLNSDSAICLKGESLDGGTVIDSVQEILKAWPTDSGLIDIIVSKDFCRLIRCPEVVGTEIEFSFPGVLSRAGMIPCRIAGLLNESHGSDGLFFFWEDSFALRKAAALKEMRDQSWTTNKVTMKGIMMKEWYELAGNPDVKKLLAQHRIGSPSSGGKPELIFATLDQESVAREWWEGKFLATIKNLKKGQNLTIARVGDLDKNIEEGRDMIQADVVLEVYANTIKNLRDIERKYEAYVQEKLQPTDPKTLGSSKLELPDISNVEVIRQVEEIEKAAETMRAFVAVLIGASVLLFAVTAGFLLGIRSDYKKNELGLLRMLGLSGNMMYLIISIQAIGLSLLGFMVGAALGIGLIALLGERTIEGVSVSHFKHSWPWLAIGLTSSVVITVIGAVLGGMPAASKSPASLVNS
jgi:hypothetical protein